MIFVDWGVDGIMVMLVMGCDACCLGCGWFLVVLVTVGSDVF